MSASNDTDTANPASTMPRVLWALLFGNFVIGTGVMVVPATLNELSGSLQVTIATADWRETLGRGR